MIFVKTKEGPEVAADREGRTDKAAIICFSIGKEYELGDREDR